MDLRWSLALFSPEKEGEGKLQTSKSQYGLSAQINDSSPYLSYVEYIKD